MNKGVRTIALGSRWVFIGLFLGYVFEYVSRIIIGRFFGPSEYGIVSLALTFSIVFASFSLLGFQTGVTRYIAIYSDKKQEIGRIIIAGIKNIIPISIICSLLLLLGRDLIVFYFFKNSSATSVVVIFILLIPIIAIAEYFYSCLRGLKLAKYAVLSREVIRRLIVLTCLVIVTIFSIKNLIFVAIAYFMGFAAYMIFSGVWLKRNVSFTNGNYSGNFKMKELILFSLPLLFSFILKRFGGHIGNIFIGFFRDTKEVGFFSAALPLSNLVSLPLNVLLFMFLPVMSKYWHKEKHEELRIILRTVNNWLFCISGLFFIFFVLYSDLIIIKSFGKEFLPAHSALIVLSAGQFFNAICGPTGSFLLAAGKSRKYFMGDFISLILSSILFVFFIPKFGFLGAAYIAAVQLVFLNIIYVTFFYKIVKVNPFTKNKLYAIGFIMIAIAMLKILDVNVIIKIILTPVVYFVILVVTGILKKESMGLLKGFLGNNFKKG